jgi:hypothetical protein
METLNGGILSYAKEFVGQKEIYGNNGFQDESFDALIRNHTTFQNGHAWCVYFCWLCWELAYDDFNVDFKQAKEEFSGGAVRTFRHFKDIGWTSKEPTLGSIAIWQKYKGSRPTPQGHAAIVEYWDEENIITIDGNTNDKGGREGYIVAEGKKRPFSFDKKDYGLVLLGFINPKQ